MSNKLPNFLIVGTAKAATTTIHEYLKQHPDIFMTEWKEPCFFTFKDRPNLKFTTDRPVKFVTDLNAYKDLFKDGVSKKIRGESSTPYLFFHEETIDNIKSVIPNYQSTKILIVLRDPIDRAFSQYMMKVRDLVEDLSFMEAIEQEELRIDNNAHFDFFYKNRGFYYKQVKAYLDTFKDVKIVLYEDFRNDNDKVLNDIVSFLDLDEISFKKIGKQNISGRPRLKIVSSLLKDNFLKRCISAVLPRKYKVELKSMVLDKNLKKEKIDDDSKKVLKRFYKEDVKKLERLIERDLSNWLN